MEPGTTDCKDAAQVQGAVPPLHSLIQMSSNKGGHPGIVSIYPFMWWNIRKFPLLLLSRLLFSQLKSVLVALATLTVP